LSQFTTSPFRAIIKLISHGSMDVNAVSYSPAVIEPGVIVGRNVLFDGPDIKLRKSSRIDSGALIAGGVEIGQGAWVKAGSVVFSSIPANSICQGNPAIVVGYQSQQTPLSQKIILGSLDLDQYSFTERTRSLKLNVGDAEIRLIKKVDDPRGSLTVGQIPDDIPFAPTRYFVISQVPSKELRGEHAHRTCHQFLVCLSGSCRVLLDDGSSRFQVTLDRAELGLYMPAMIWGTQYSYSPDAVLLVFASHHYDPNDYIHSYAEFLSLAKRVNGSN